MKNTKNNGSKSLVRACALLSVATLAVAACSSAGEAGDDDDDSKGGSSATSGAGPTGGSATGGTGMPTGGVSGAGPTGGSGGSVATGGTGQSGAAGKGGSGGGRTAMDYFIGPSGSDTNPGTEAAPFLTLSRGNLAALPGTTLWVLPGNFAYDVTMDLTVSGTTASPIRLWAVAGARPVLDYATQARGSSGRGIELSGNYWHIRGVEIKNAGDNGILISGSNNTIENVITHHNADTGIQITVSEAQAATATLGASNTILNCDSYENFDTMTNGENADGFAAKLRIGAGNVFRGCRAWNNADDGYDFFAADDVVVVESSWAFLNGFVAGGGNSAGDGNGFKLGGTPNGTGQGDAPHRVSGVAAFENRNCGFTRNNNADSPVLMTCAVADNGDDYCSLSCSPESAVTVTGAAAKTLARAADGSLPSID